MNRQNVHGVHGTCHATSELQSLEGKVLYLKGLLSSLPGKKLLILYISEKQSIIL